MLQKAQRGLAEFDGCVRWAREEQMHLTLKFLGEVGAGEVSKLTAALSAATARCAAFTLRTLAAGCFPPRGKTRVLWVGVSDESGALATCQQAIEDALAEAGFPREDRAFSPHLTLGRVTDDRSGGALRERTCRLRIPELEQPVKEVLLMQSELRPQGARYTKLGGFALGQS